MQPPRTIDDASEDDQLAAAIAASLQNGSDSDGQIANGDDDDSDMEEETKEDDAPAFEPLGPEPASAFGYEQCRHHKAIIVSHARHLCCCCLIGDAPGVTRVQIRAPDGSRLVRRFLKTDAMSMLWAFVKEQVRLDRGALCPLCSVDTDPTHARTDPRGAQSGV